MLGINKAIYDFKNIKYPNLNKTKKFFVGKDVFIQFVFENEKHLIFLIAFLSCRFILSNKTGRLKENGYPKQILLQSCHLV